MNIEKGIDKDNRDVWFVLDGANMVTSFHSESEANEYILNSK